MRNRTSVLQILHSSALPPSHRDSTVSVEFLFLQYRNELWLMPTNHPTYFRYISPLTDIPSLIFLSKFWGKSTHGASSNHTSMTKNQWVRQDNLSFSCITSYTGYAHVHVFTWMTLLQNSSDVRKETSSGKVAHRPLSKEYQSSEGMSSDVGKSEYKALSPVANT